MYALIITLALEAVLVVLGLIFTAVFDYLRWRARERGAGFWLKVVDRQRHTLEIRKEMLAELIAQGEIIKFRHGHKWIRVDDDTMRLIACGKFV